MGTQLLFNTWVGTDKLLLKIEANASNFPLVASSAHRHSWHIGSLSTIFHVCSRVGFINSIIPEALNTPRR